MKREREGTRAGVRGRAGAGAGAGGKGQGQGRKQAGQGERSQPRTCSANFVVIRGHLVTSVDRGQGSEDGTARSSHARASLEPARLSWRSAGGACTDGGWGGTRGGRRAVRRGWRPDERADGELSRMGSRMEVDASWMSGARGLRQPHPSACVPAVQACPARHPMPCSGAALGRWMDVSDRIIGPRRRIHASMHAAPIPTIDRSNPFCRGLSSSLHVLLCACP